MGIDHSQTRPGAQPVSFEQIGSLRRIDRNRMGNTSDFANDLRVGQHAGRKCVAPEGSTIVEIQQDRLVVRLGLIFPGPPGHRAQRNR